MDKIMRFLNNDVFLDWFFMSLIGFLTYILSSLRKKVYTPVRIPRWLVCVVGVRTQRDGAVDLNTFASQLFGILLILLACAVALIYRKHTARLYAFSTGILVVLLCVGLITIFLKLKT